MLMQKLFIHRTSTTPEVDFSPEDNIFLINGISSPEDVRAMYYPVIEWVVAFVNEIIEGTYKDYKPNYPLKFKADLVYFNSSSAKFLYDIFIELKRLIPLGIPVIVEWFYDEEDIDLKEGGMDIALLAEMEFLFIPKKTGSG
jgi:SiaC family regulatory phosphoprotein